MTRAQVDLTQIVLFLILGGVLLFAYYNLRSARRNQRALTVWLIVVYTCAVLLVGNIGLYAWRTFGMTASEVRITVPKDGETVSKDQEVDGTSWKLPADKVIWVVVINTENGQYFPMPQAATVDESGNWSSSGSIGTDSDITIDMEIIALLADKTAQKEFNDYILSAKSQDNPNGMDALPGGATVMDRITITRK